MLSPYCQKDDGSLGAKGVVNTPFVVIKITASRTKQLQRPQALMPKYPEKWITAGGRRLSLGTLKFVFLSESGRRHIVFLCGHDSPCDAILPFVSAELKMKILARSGEMGQAH